MSVSKPKGKKRKPRQRPPEYEFVEQKEFVPQFNNPLDAIVARLSDAMQATSTQNSDGTWKRQFAAICPAHNDHNKSLSLSETEDSNAIVHCHAGCSAEQIMKSLGLQTFHLYREGAARTYTPKPNPWRYYVRATGSECNE